MDFVNEDFFPSLFPISSSSTFHPHLFPLLFYFLIFIKLALVSKLSFKMLMMDSLSNDIMNESAFDIANSMIQAEMGLNVPQLNASVGSPIEYRPQIDFGEEDLTVNPSWIHQINPPMVAPNALAVTPSTDANNTRLRRRKATQPQRLVYCDLDNDDLNPQSENQDGSVDADYQMEPNDNVSESKDVTFNIDCSDCGESFMDKKEYLKHVKLVHRKKNAKKACNAAKSCPICGINLYNSQALRNHISRIHEEKEMKFKCELCDKSYFSKSELKQHGAVHCKDKNFTCEECGKNFAAKHHLVRHSKTHFGLKPFECDICHKQLADKTGFIAHVRNHRGERPFACTFCDKTYTIRRHLTTHLKIHSSARPFVCQVEGCSKTFRSRSNFRMHKDTHEGIKRWSCPVCNRRFLSQGNMAKHVRRHVGLKPYSCDFCEKSFIERQELRNHLKVHSKSVRTSKNKEVPCLAELQPAKVLIEDGDGHANLLPCSILDRSCQSGSVSSSQDDLSPPTTLLSCNINSSSSSSPDSNILTISSSNSPTMNSIESNVYTNGEIGDGTLFNNCSLCSNYFHSSHSLKDHLIDYHRVEMGKIN